VNAKKLRPSYQPFEENSSLEKEPGENVRKFGFLSIFWFNGIAGSFD
jgi:hypothetical protein